MASLLICSIVLLLLSTGMACTDLTLGILQTNPATSCNEIYKCNPISRGTVGQNWIRGNNGVLKVTCNMKLKCGGIEGGWMQVVDVDMNKDTTCPAGWQTITVPRSSVGRYQYFASGIRYYKFKTVFSISRYFGLIQIHKLHLIIGIFYIKLTLTE